MYLQPCHISCGIMQLVGVSNYPTQEDFNNAIFSTRKTGGPYPCAVVMASLTQVQTGGIAFLEKNGFKRITEWRKNPNSDNKIALFSANVADGKIDIETVLVASPIKVAPIKRAPMKYVPIKYDYMRHWRPRDTNGKFIGPVDPKPEAQFVATTIYNVPPPPPPIAQSIQA